MLCQRMDYTVQREQEHLLVRLTGAPSENEIRGMLRDLQAQSAGARGALFELQVAFGLNLIETKALVTGLPAIGFAPGFRLAVLLLDDAAARSAQFAEDVAFNRGIGLRVFRERAEALAWLGAASAAL
jgi:hypothetical protein